MVGAEPRLLVKIEALFTSGQAGGIRKRATLFPLIFDITRR